MKSILEKIKELEKNPRGKAILFFAFYLLFFIIVIVFTRLGARNILSNYNYDSGDKFNLARIEEDNYKYLYEVKLDDVVYSLDGKKDGIKEEFSFMNNNYYKRENEYFILSNGIYEESAEPTTFSYFFDINNLKDLLEDAYFLSKTDYESGKRVYNYLLDTNVILKKYENLETDIDAKACEIILSTNEDGDTNQIKLRLESFCKYKGLCINDLEITLNYEDFGNIEINNSLIRG